MISSSIKHTALGGCIIHDEMGQDVLEASYWIYKGPGWSPRLSLCRRTASSQQSQGQTVWQEDQWGGQGADFTKDTTQVTSHKNWLSDQWRGQGADFTVVWGLLLGQEDRLQEVVWGDSLHIETPVLKIVGNKTSLSVKSFLLVLSPKV